MIILVLLFVPVQIVIERFVVFVGRENFCVGI